MKPKTDWLNIKSWLYSGLTSAVISLSFTIIIVDLANQEFIWVGLLIFKFILIFSTIKMQPFMKNSLELIQDR